MLEEYLLEFTHTSLGTGGDLNFDPPLPREVCAPRILFTIPLSSQGSQPNGRLLLPNVSGQAPAPAPQPLQQQVSFRRFFLILTSRKPFSNTIDRNFSIRLLA